MLRKLGTGLTVAVLAGVVGAACSAPQSQVQSKPTGGRTSQAQVGQTISLSGNKSGEKMDVTMVKVVDPAQPGSSISANPGNKLVAVQVKLVNTGSATYSDAPGNGMKVYDAQGQSFSSDLTPISGCPEFATGTATVTPGGDALGCVAFQTPTASPVTKITFALDSGFAPQVGQWLVSPQQSPGTTLPPPTTVTSQPPLSAPTSAPPAPSAPGVVVQRYWNDMNAGNFAEAWSLGGSNLQSNVGSESAFAAQNAVAVGTTLVTITGVVGNQVYVNLSSGGNTFTGSYTVSNGVIVSGTIQKTN